MPLNGDRNGIAALTAQGRFQLMALIQLVYVSVESIPMDDDELARIIESAKRHNGERGVTGMLMYSAGKFMQLLEGEEADVEATFARVCQDPRHRDIEVVERGPIDARSYPDWRMGLKRLDDAPVPAQPAVARPARTGTGLASRLLLELAAAKR